MTSQSLGVLSFGTHTADFKLSVRMPTREARGPLPSPFRLLAASVACSYGMRSLVERHLGTFAVPRGCHPSQCMALSNTRLLQNQREGDLVRL